jgi:hypothetical protein
VGQKSGAPATDPADSNYESREGDGMRDDANIDVIHRASVHRSMNLAKELTQRSIS